MPILLITVMFIGPLALGLLGVRRTATAGEHVGTNGGYALGATWSLVINSAVLYALAYNLTFFLQELFLVIPKAVYGLQPILYHNNHRWLGSDPIENLLQGFGTLAILISGLVFRVVMSRQKDFSRPPQTVFNLDGLSGSVAVTTPGCNVGPASEPRRRGCSELSECRSNVTIRPGDRCSWEPCFRRFVTDETIAGPRTFVFACGNTGSSNQIPGTDRHIVSADWHGSDYPLPDSSHRANRGAGNRFPDAIVLDVGECLASQRCTPGRDYGESKSELDSGRRIDCIVGDISIIAGSWNCLLLGSLNPNRTPFTATVSQTKQFQGQQRHPVFHSYAQLLARNERTHV